MNNSPDQDVPRVTMLQPRDVKVLCDSPFIGLTSVKPRLVHRSRFARRAFTHCDVAKHLSNDPSQG